MLFFILSMLLQTIKNTQNNQNNIPKTYLAAIAKLMRFAELASTCIDNHFLQQIPLFTIYMKDSFTPLFMYFCYYKCNHL